MSLDKAIKYGKEHREPYRHGKAVDKTCRNHGGCPWCEGNRQHSHDVRKECARYKEEEYMKDEEIKYDKIIDKFLEEMEGGE